MALDTTYVDRQRSFRSSGDGPIGGHGTIRRGRTADNLRSSSNPEVAHLAARSIAARNSSERLGSGERTMHYTTSEKRSVKMESAAVQASIRNPGQEGKNLETGLYAGVKTKKHPLGESFKRQESFGSVPKRADRREDHEETQRLLRDEYEVEEIPTCRMSLTARDVNEFAVEEIGAAGVFATEEPDFNPGLHRNLLGLATDIPSMAQNIESTVITASGGQPDLGMASGIKLSSTFAILTGVLTTQVATERAVKAHEIGDVVGEELAMITQARGVTECSMGFVLGTLRGLTIASVYTAAQSVAAAAKIFGDISTGFASAFYILIAIPPAITAIRQFRFKQEFDATVGIGSNPYEKARFGMHFLMKQLMLDDVEREEALEIIPVTIYDDLMRMFTEEVELTKEEYESLTEADFAFIAKKAPELVERIREAHPLMSNLEVASGHVKIRLAKELVRMMKVKEAELSRNAGVDTLRLVKEELHKPLEEQILYRLENTEENELALEEAEAIIGVASKENLHNLIFNIVIVTTCIIGVIGFILASVFTAGAPLYVALAIIILSNVMMFGVDIYSFAQEVKDMKATPKDRILIMITSALSIVFTAVGAMIAAGPLIRLILILIGVLFAGFQLGVLGWSWYNEENSKAKTV